MLSLHGKSSTSATNVGGKQRIHTTFEDGVEMVEEYDLTTDQLLTRRWKSKSTLGRESEWQYEIGEANRTPSAREAGIAANRHNPELAARDTKNAWEWRIRNLPYPKHVYSLSVETKEDETQEIVLRTTNRKYFKRFKIPAMCRHNLKLDEARIAFTHANNTLVIQYEKPDEILHLEQKMAKARAKSKTQQDGNVDCKQQ